jgi:UDP-glucose 4-epimerase
MTGEGSRGLGTALVTGGAGFIGSHLVDRLLASGYRVLCVDNFTLGRREHLEDALKSDRFGLHDFDLLDLSKLDDFFASEDIDVVFHLAANSDIREGTRSTDRDLQLTFMTTFNVLECMRRHAVKKLLFTSTPAIFGEHEEALHEETAARPESLYGASKLSAEAFIMAFSGLYDIQAWICRLSNIVGERSTHGIILDLLNKLDLDKEELEVLGDGTQTKPYMYVRDIVEAFMFIYGNSHERLNIFNIGPRDATTVADIAAMVLDAAGQGQRIAYTGGSRGWKGDVPLYRYQPSKLEALGWPRPMSSDEAVRVAIERTMETR